MTEEDLLALLPPERRRFVSYGEFQGRGGTDYYQGLVVPGSDGRDYWVYDGGVYWREDDVIRAIGCGGFQDRDTEAWPEEPRARLVLFALALMVDAAELQRCAGHEFTWTRIGRKEG